MRHTAFLLLGSNLKNPAQQLRSAISSLEDKVGIILKKSSVYRTAAWGFTDQPDFLNQVVKMETTLGAENCMEILLEIERSMGRIRTTPNAPRSIDIDILFFDNLVMDTHHLTLPHPDIAKRRFVLVPMHELEPDLLHPILNKNMATLLSICPDTLDVSKM